MFQKYDKRFLELMSFLTLNKKFMNNNEIAKAFAKEKKISERTVRRWFKIMQKHCFDYFPALHYERLGLHWVSVLIENLKDSRFLKLSPFLVYVYSGVNFQNCKKTLFLGYLIPDKNQKDLEVFLQTAKKQDVFGDYYAFVTKTPVTYSYAPFHKVVDSQGNLNLADGYDNSYFIDLLKENLKQPHNCEITADVKKNPLLIPMLFEYVREHWSSRKVWFNAKQKLGNSIWGYVRSIKRRKRKLDAVGIRLVQETYKFLNNNAERFFQQTRIVYSPFHEKSAIFFLLVKLKDEADMADFCERVSKNSLIAGFCPSVDKKGVVGLYVVTSVESATHVICDLMLLYADMKNFNHKVVWLDYKESDYFWTSRKYMKFDYSKVFDPKRCEWIYERNQYMSELKKLANKD